MNKHAQKIKKMESNMYYSIFPLVIISFLCSCGTDGEPEDPAAGLVDTSAVAAPFPDSTNLRNAPDSLAFAEDCVFNHNRRDIADRYFKGIVKGWNRQDICNETVSESFAWLSSEESRKPGIDTALMFAWLDSSILACPSSSNAYVVYGALLMQFERKGAEAYFNLAMEKGADIYNVSEHIAANPGKLDTAKLNFDWLNSAELHFAPQGE
jgi:hypothetical protein